jgi:hypothetical protein
VREALVALLLVGMLVAAGLLLSRHAASEASGEKPRLALISSLPLLFGEEFGLATPRPAAMGEIEAKYTVVPVAVADRASLTGFSQLLMAHPRAQPADVLVELDQWVRDGGQVVVLADPHLAWESKRPLGDPLRPPPDFADTGLLAHWGLRLGVDEQGGGVLRATSPSCTAGNDGLVAECRVGRGTARIIADADFMLGEGEDAAARLGLLLDQLAAGDSR